MDLVTFGTANAVVGAESTVGLSLGSAVNDVLLTIAGDRLLGKQTSTVELVTSGVIMGIVPVDANGERRKEPLLSPEGAISGMAKLVAVKAANKLVKIAMDDLLSK